MHLGNAVSHVVMVKYGILKSLLPPANQGQTDCFTKAALKEKKMFNYIPEYGKNSITFGNYYIFV